MKNINCFVIGLFVVSLVFAAGNSFSQSRQSSFGEPSQSSFGQYGKELGQVYLKPAPYSEPGAGATPVFYVKPGNPSCTVSTMISSELKSTERDYLAEISDLIIDPANGNVSDVVLSRIRGMGAKGGVIPFGDVIKAGDAIYLYNAPEDAYRFVGEAPYQNGGWALELHSEHMPMAGLTASKLIGAPVRTSKGEDLGRIQDLIVDHMSGQVVKLVVSGTKGKPTAVPFSSLSEGSKGSFILKAS